MAPAPKLNGNDVDLKRDVIIRLRVSVPEKRRFEKLAKLRHTDLSELVRQVLHKEADSTIVRQGA